MFEIGYKRNFNSKNTLMRMCKYLLTIILILYSLLLQAQNKKFDWGIGVNAGTYSYSALLESKLTNPYEYRIGSSLSVSRYLTNNFNLSIEGSRTPIDFPVNPSAKGEPLKYTDTYLYGANFTLKYKINNGYIIKENSMFAPYFSFGGGAYLTDYNPNITYIVPLGAGVEVHLGDRTSFIFESQYNRDVIGGELSYMQHNAGIKIHFGKANKKRLKATKQRNRSRQLAKIRKYREEQRIAQARKAKAKLQKLQQEGLVSKIPTMDEDEDLLMTNESIAMRPDEQPKKINAVTTPPSKPKESNLGKKPTLKSRPAEPVVPVSPGKPTVKELQPTLPDTKPPMRKPSSSRPEITDVAEESTVTKPVVITKEKPEATVTTPETLTPTVIKPEVPRATVPKPVVVPIPSTPVVPEHPQTQVPIKETDKVCENRQRELSELGERIIFDKNRYRVRSAMHQDLRQIELLLNDCDKHAYVIIAHTDSDGNMEYNKKLSAERAEAVKAYLVNKGIDAARLITIPYGSSVPIVPNTTDENKAKNRRIEFRLNRTGFED
jgi:outer membrane protein OmpA-like peptidoglycan-associated protein